MMRMRVMVVGLLALAGAAAGGIAAMAPQPQSIGPVYTVAQVQMGLARHPREWIGRTVRVRGTSYLLWWEYASSAGASCASAACTWRVYRIGIVDDRLYSASIGVQSASLTRYGLNIQIPHPASNPIQAFVGRLPLFGRLFAASPQDMQLYEGLSGVFRIKILPAATTCVWPGSCDAAVLASSL